VCSVLPCGIPQCKWASVCVCVLVDHLTYVLTDVWVHRLRDETDVCKLNCTLETRFVSQVSPITCTPLQTPTCILKNEYTMPPPPPPTITHTQDILEQTRHLPTAYLSQPPAQPLGASASLIPKLKRKDPCVLYHSGQRIFLKTKKADPKHCENWRRESSSEFQKTSKMCERGEWQKKLRDFITQSLKQAPLGSCAI